jgi:ATP-dependent HslUV protease ATP-binding subunit HslU
MILSMKHLTPKETVAELDKYIIGQREAKKAVAVAIRNRWRRQQLAAGLRQDVSPKNIIMIGPTGVGKTEIARRLAGLTGSPFVKVEATKYTEVGYQGRDVESMVRDLLDASLVLVREEMTETVRAQAEAGVEDRLLDALLPQPEYGDEEALQRAQATREKLRAQLREGKLENSPVDIVVEEKATAASMFGSLGMEMDVQMQSMLERMMPARRDGRRMTIAAARNYLLGQEAEKHFDKNKLTAEAIERADVSRQGVQRDLLPIVEGSTVMTKYGAVKTDHVLFIAAGAFHTSSPSEMMPELQGRFPIRVELHDLKEEDFVRILTEPQNSLIKQQVQLLATEGVTVEVTEEAIEEMAEIAFTVNRKQQNIGARRLHTILEKVFETIGFEAPDLSGKTLRIDGRYVRDRLEKAKGDDLSRILL